MRNESYEESWSCEELRLCEYEDFEQPHTERRSTPTPNSTVYTRSIDAINKYTNKTEMAPLQ